MVFWSSSPSTYPRQSKQWAPDPDDIMLKLWPLGLKTQGIQKQSEHGFSNLTINNNIIYNKVRFFFFTFTPSLTLLFLFLPISYRTAGQNNVCRICSLSTFFCWAPFRLTDWLTPSLHSACLGPVSSHIIIPTPVSTRKINNQI